MKKYKVISLSVSAPKNKIFKSGAIVSENNWGPGIADNLVRQGFLKEISEDLEETAPEPVPQLEYEEPEQKPAKIIQKAPPEKTPPAEPTPGAFTLQTKTEEIKKFLIQSGVSFSASASKEVLLELANKAAAESKPPTPPETLLQP